MSNKVTLGGDRLGSGQKQKVELHGYERSTHDLGYVWRSTMAPGTLVPFMSMVALPGDTFDIDLNMVAKTHPTIGPLFGSFKAQLDVFMVPMRLYHSALHNNMLGIGMKMSNIKLPKVRLLAIGLQETTEDFDNFQVNPSSIFAYLGIRGVGIVPGIEAATENVFRKFNAIPWLAYWEIYKNYYSNKQEEEGVVIHTPTAVPEDDPFIEDGIYFENPSTSESTPINQAPGFGFYTPEQGFKFYADLQVGDPQFNPDLYVLQLATGENVTFRQYTGGLGRMVNSNTRYTGPIAPQYINVGVFFWNYATNTTTVTVPPRLYRFPLENIDTMRQRILAEPYNAEFIVDGEELAPYDWAVEVGGTLGAQRASFQNTQEGLGIKTYQSDLFNNWLSTEWIDGTGGINDITKVDTSEGYFNIDALMLSRKVYDMLNRIAVSGGTYDDWLSAVYDHESYTRAESPVYMGGLSKEIVFQEVVSQSDSSGQPLGTLAGKGVMGDKHKGGKVVIKTDEPAYIIGIVSLTPRIDYSQGNTWDVNLDTIDDLHKPGLDQIGFQELITEQMAWWSTRKIIGAPVWEQKSAGKQPAWTNYMTNVNRVLGNFAIQNNEMFMVLNRKYEPVFVDNDNLAISDLTTYIDPVKYNHIFAQTSLDAQNFWVQIAVDITARRKMSAKVMPNL